MLRQTLHSLHTNLSTTVGVGKNDRRFAMVDPPIVQEFLGVARDDNSSGIPSVMNIRFSKSTNPIDPSEERSAMGIVWV